MCGIDGRKQNSFLTTPDAQQTKDLDVLPFRPRMLEGIGLLDGGSGSLGLFRRSLAPIVIVAGNEGCDLMFSVLFMSVEFG